MAKGRILYINQGVMPFSEETEATVMNRYLPQYTQELGREIRVFVPRFTDINERKHQLHEVIRLSGMNLIIDDTDHPLIIKCASIPVSRITVYFIDNDDYFQKRKMEEDEAGEEYADNGERAIFFARGVLETMKKLRWTPDLIVCQGWMSAVVPLYVKTAYREEPVFAHAKVVTSLFTKQLKSDLGSKFKQCVEFREAKASLLSGYSDDFNFVELGKLAIDYSDGIVEAGSEVNPALLDYAQGKGLPIMHYPGADDYAEAYHQFYTKIIDSE